MLAEEVETGLESLCRETMRPTDWTETCACCSEPSEWHSSGALVEVLGKAWAKTLGHNKLLKQMPQEKHIYIYIEVAHVPRLIQL
jgi:hypothetical protein